MEYKKQIHGEEEEEEEDEDDDEEIELPSSTSLGFNPLSSSFSLRGSAFSRPILSPSSSLISSRGRGGGAAASAAKNVSPFGGSADPAAEKAAAAAGNPKDAASGGSGGKNRYRECLRNHAAASGGYVLDGCGEFMPAEGEEELKCAACGCHRSFHRKESKDAAVDAYYRGAASAPLPLLLPAPPHHQHQKQFQFGAPVTPSSGGAGGTTTESSSEERINAAVRQPTAQRKRFRTKFTAEQKEKMQAFAERIGWRIQKHDEAAAERFFEEAGVSRHVFKVWMHNNKHLIKKPQQEQEQKHQQEEEEDDREEQQPKLPQEQHMQRSHSDRSP